MPHRAPRRHFLGLAARWAAAGTLASQGWVRAQAPAPGAWPTKAVRLVVPVGAGGTTDILARAVGQALQQLTGQPFVVDLKPGANGAIGAVEVMRQPADGYTLLVGTASTHGIAPAVIPNLGFGVDDFTPLSLLADPPAVLMVSPKLGIKSLRELVELARSKPGVLNYYSTGVGSYTHLMSVLLEQSAKVKMTNVPYKGFGQAYPDLVSGATHVTWDAIASAQPYVKDGRLTGLAVTGTKRAPSLPDLPTVTEALAQMGLPGFSSTAWFGLYGPRGMAPDLARQISDAVNKALKSSDLQARYAQLGLDPVQSSPAEFGAMWKADVERWRRVVRETGIKVE